MHGMLSAAILICLFAATAVACLYLAVRVFAAGRQPSPGAGSDQGPEAP
jgi:hypothetical protein